MDKGWFLSSVAQSTAAMVAIIGGFLVSRLVALISERTSSLARFEEGRVRLVTATREWSAASQAAERLIWPHLMDRSREALIAQALKEAASGVPLPSAASRIVMRSLPTTVSAGRYPRITSRAEELMGEYREYATLITAHVNKKTDYKDVAVGVVMRRIGKDFSPANPVRFEEVLDSIREDLRTRPRPSSSTLDGYAALDRIAPDLMSESAKMSRLSDRKSDEEQVRRADAKTSDAFEKLQAITDEVAHLRSEMTEIPLSDIRHGLWVLSAFSFVGIVLPLVAMAFAPSEHPPGWVIYTLLVTYTVGLGAVLHYLFSLVARVKEPAEIESLELKTDPGQQ